MAYKPVRTNEEDTTEINLTSLIDVSLVLVLILLLATPLAFESSISVKGAEAAARTAESPTKVVRIEIVVHDGARVSVNQREYGLADLATVLGPLLVETPSAPVLVRCETGVAHGTFVEVLDEAKASGAVSIAVLPTEHDGNGATSPRRG